MLNRELWFLRGRRAQPEISFEALTAELSTADRSAVASSLTTLTVGFQPLTETQINLDRAGRWFIAAQFGFTDGGGGMGGWEGRIAFRQADGFLSPSYSPLCFAHEACIALTMPTAIIVQVTVPVIAIGTPNTATAILEARKINSAGGGLAGGDRTVLRGWLLRP